jgi:hypothetical protein
VDRNETCELLRQPAGLQDELATQSKSPCNLREQRSCPHGSLVASIPSLSSRDCSRSQLRGAEYALKIKRSASRIGRQHECFDSLNTSQKSQNRRPRVLIRQVARRAPIVRCAAMIESGGNGLTPFKCSRLNILRKHHKSTVRTYLAASNLDEHFSAPIHPSSGRTDGVLCWPKGCGNMRRPADCHRSRATVPTTSTKKILP